MGPAHGWHPVGHLEEASPLRRPRHHLPDYPFAPASVRRDRHLTWSTIRDLDPGTAPPEARTVDGETLFVDARQADEPWSACDNAGRPLVDRIDVWDLLLEPYLDTAFDAENQERTPSTEASHREALRQNPEYVNAHNNLGNVLVDRGDLKDLRGVGERFLMPTVRRELEKLT